MIGVEHEGCPYFAANDERGQWACNKCGQVGVVPGPTGIATFITEVRGVGFIARCACGWEDATAGYDMAAAIRAESRHADGHVSQNGGTP